MVRAQRTHLNVLAAALVAGTVAISCGGEKKETPDDQGGPGGTESGMGGMGGTSGALTLAFNPMYSAFDDNAHEFLVPVKVTGATGKLTVKTQPDGFVQTRPHADGIMLVTQKAGECTVTITDEDGNSGSAKLTVTQNGPSDVDIGKERYANGIDAFNLPEGGIVRPEGGFPGFGEGGLPEGGFNFREGGIRFPEGGLGIMRNANAACTFCHIPEGAPVENMTMGQVDVEHTPQQTAGYSDDDLIAIFTMAKKPMGAPYRVVNGGGLIPDDVAQTIYARFHTWEVAPETQKGIVAYLRSLTPKAQPAIDFGGLLRGGVPGLGGRMGGGGAMTGGTMPAMDAGAP
jgi:hypothetical protein